MQKYIKNQGIRIDIGMKSFMEWLKEQSTPQQKPILFVGNNSAIIPSDHEMGIKVPDPQTIEKLKPMAHSVYYEGTGEKGQGGGFESSWVQKNLGVSPKAQSYDQIGKMYQRCAGGLGPAVVLYSNLNVNEIVGKNFSGGTVRDAIISAIAKGGPEGNVTDPAKAKEFVDICEKEIGKEQLDSPSSNYVAVAKAIEKAMWPGGDDPGNGPIGRLADQVEKERRAMIVNMASQNSGLYFLGSGHLPSMKKEHPNLPSDIEQPQQQQASQQQQV
jgi:hypothetical protein